jgi:hypothetical protein
MSEFALALANFSREQGVPVVVRLPSNQADNLITFLSGVADGTVNDKGSKFTFKTDKWTIVVRRAK